jgi:hypothetical protein
LLSLSLSLQAEVEMLLSDVDEFRVIIIFHPDADIAVAIRHVGDLNIFALTCQAD